MTNLGRAITEKLSVRMQGQEVQSLSLYGEYWGIRDMYLTKAQRSTISRPQQECDDMAEQGNINLLCCNANAASATGTNAAIATVFGKNPSQFCTPLAFNQSRPFHPSSFGDLLEYEIDYIRLYIFVTTKLQTILIIILLYNLYD